MGTILLYMEEEGRLMDISGLILSIEDDIVHNQSGTGVKTSFIRSRLVAEDRGDTFRWVLASHESEEVIENIMKSVVLHISAQTSKETVVIHFDSTVDKCIQLYERQRLSEVATE